MTETPLRRLEATAPFDHDDGLNFPVSMLDAAEALIFLLLDSSSSRLDEEEEPDDCENIEAALINARLSFLFFSNFEENLTREAVTESSLEAGSSRTPRPIFLEAASSSATLFF